jgi:hypothetical protein
MTNVRIEQCLMGSKANPSYVFVREEAHKSFAMVE